MFWIYCVLKLHKQNYTKLKVTVLLTYRRKNLDLKMGTLFSNLLDSKQVHLVLLNRIPRPRL